MPNAQRDSSGKYGVRSATATGPVAYAAGARPTITLPLRDIASINDVEMWCDGGFGVRPVSRVRNVVTYMVTNLNRTGAAGAVNDHAAHNHDLKPDVAKGGAVTDALGVDGAGNLETANAGIVAMATAIQDAAAVAHAGAAAATKTAAFEEVLDGTVLNATNFYARAYGRIN